MLHTPIITTHPTIGVTAPHPRNRPSNTLLIEFVIPTGYHTGKDPRDIFTRLPHLPVHELTLVVNPGRTTVVAGEWAGGPDRQVTRTTMNVYVDGDHAQKTSGLMLDYDTAVAIATRVTAGASYVGLLIDGHTVTVDTL